MYDYFKQLQIVFKKSYGLPMDVKNIQVAFKSIFVNKPNQNPFLLVKKTRVEWEIMSSPVLVNLANLLAC